MIKITNEVMDAYVELVRKYAKKSCLSYTDIKDDTIILVRNISEGMNEIDKAEFMNRLNTETIRLMCPAKGTFVGYKKCFMESCQNMCIVKLEIPVDAYRSSAFGNKCRCSKAKVLDIYNPETGERYKEAMSLFNFNFKYRIGETVECDKWEPCRFVECGGGIHFFMSEKEAVLFKTW